MRRFARGGSGALAVVLVATLAMWIGTRGNYGVPALVTHDPALPAALIAGHRLHLRVDGPPEAEAVIVLHGGPGGDFASLEALAALANTWRVVFYDQRGAGLSERVEAEDLIFDGHLDELAAVIDHVSPDRPVVLIGHSWGAMLAAAYLGRDPARVDRAVLIEPGYLDAAERDDWRQESRRFMSGPRYAVAAVTNGFRAARVDGPDDQARDDFLIGRMVHAFADHPDNPYHCGTGYGAPMRRFGAMASAAWEAAPAADIDRIGRGAGSFDGPVLLLAGACDDWLGAPLQERHLARFARAELAVIPDAGHDVVWDNPDAALAEIRSFLARPR
ncbi:alpha/beta fold hydrolase [Wenxinia marina]|uniref:Putative hydrolase or acyltransferase (Alpha/beta hydrolase superfamily) n=1 Tax=Wenxinia marina DSM 24838 TaxID=1123501 RepID=A0A0D0NSP2_9RHOB|nr:alpha/beta fold hydrolase [Wenxinia marina]KIQ71190.1 putative hydrolase or acyltransferase (alpha/beta hydrolase superfamily) [Wenxinia marina DSM 24838]GGL81782.1 hypothetical protein GCM10011392_40480 [Wenxinia marina]